MICTDQESNCLGDIETSEPESLYKYYAFNKYTEGIYKHNKVYFPPPESFNDPFDSKIYITYEGSTKKRRQFLLDKFNKLFPNKSRKNLLEHAKKLVKEGEDIAELQRSLEKSANKLRKKIGVFCLTEKRDNILMWTHYSAQHTGFCLKFDAKNKFFLRSQKVKYDKVLPIINVLCTYPPIEEAQKILTKAEDWKYEKEWRIVDYKKGPGVQKYPEEALTGVILGCWTSDENKQKIREWCGKRRYCPTLYQAKEKEKEYGLDIVVKFRSF